MPVALFELASDLGWQRRARCGRPVTLWLWWGLSSTFPFDVSLFFPDDGHKHKAKLARRICATCPVAPDCLEYALDNFIRDGIWGGTSERERRVLQRQRREAQQQLAG